MNTSQTACDVIVIGAGAAGLAATKELRAWGLSVLCLEAADRAGGRCITDTETFGVPFDRGGHWLHNRPTNPFVEIGHALGFDIYPTPKTYVTEGGEAADRDLSKILDRFDEKLDIAAEAGQDMSAADLFDVTGPWAHTAASLYALPMGRDLDEISVVDKTEGWIEENWFCREGFGALLERYHATTPVTLNTPVTKLASTREGVDVTTHVGTIRAHAAIVTVSQGVLASETITFDPPLDAERREAIVGINMGTYNHTALLFEPGTIPVAEDSWMSYRIDAAQDGSVRGGGFLCNIGGTGLCSFETAGRFSRELEAAGTKAATEIALDVLTRMYGNSVRAKFIRSDMTAWTKNPWTRGSYSGALPGCTHLRPRLKAPHAERILFAGEAMSDANRGTVAGAHHEGIRA
ncbi:MAG: NAD(P)/FAD-dependent oxidoreductase, partial [Pseudomonadota bacterium]